MTRTSRFDFSSGPNPDPAYQWDTKRKVISLVEVCALPSALVVFVISISSIVPSIVLDESNNTPRMKTVMGNNKNK